MNDPENIATACERVRARLEAAGRRFHANDNISEFIHGEAELKALEDEATARMQAVLEALVIDTQGDHNTRGTARRVARMFLHEVFKGRYHRMPSITEFPNAERLNELVREASELVVEGEPETEPETEPQPSMSELAETSVGNGAGVGTSPNGGTE